MDALSGRNDAVVVASVCGFVHVRPPSVDVTAVELASAYARPSGPTDTHGSDVLAGPKPPAHAPTGISVRRQVPPPSSETLPAMPRAAASGNRSCWYTTITRRSPGATAIDGSTSAFSNALPPLLRQAAKGLGNEIVAAVSPRAAAPESGSAAAPSRTTTWARTPLLARCFTIHPSVCVQVEARGSGGVQRPLPQELYSASRRKVPSLSQRVGEGGRELSAPEAPVVPAGHDEEALRDSEAAELAGERTGMTRDDPVVTARREEEARVEASQCRALAKGEQRRVVRLQHALRCTLERAVCDRDEIPAPRFRRPEQTRMPQRDVDGAVASRRIAPDRTRGAAPPDGEMTIRPRQHVVDDEALPDAGPFAVVSHGFSGGGHDRDERRHAVGFDLAV